MGGGSGKSRSIHKFFSPQLNLQESNRIFSKKTIIFHGSRGGPTLSRGGGGSNCIFLIST